MKDELWKPNIPLSSDLMRQIECFQLQDEINLETKTGGCYGVVCDNCILYSDNREQFNEWTNSHNKQQDLF